MAFEITKQEIIKQAIALNKLWKQTRDQKYRDEELRLRRVAAELDNFVNLASSGVGSLQQVSDIGNVTTNTIDTAGTKSDYFLLDTTATPTLEPGMFGWNDAFGTADLRLKGDNVTLQVGQEIIARVVNKTGADLLESDYKVVRVRIASEGGAQGQRLAVELAQGDNDPDSVTTLGIVTETILNNEEGFITILGNVSDIDTTGTLQGETWVDGDVLYLSPTTPGALTKVPPVSPQHTVTMGYVVYAHQNQGKIFVKVDNGYELDELHNVLISSVADNDILRYDATEQVWKNEAFPAETDPTVPSHVKAITTDQITNWDTSYDNMVVSATITGDVTKTLNLGQQDGGVVSVSFTDTYVHVQGAPSASWGVTHNMNKWPSVTVVDSGNNIVEGDVVYNSLNDLTIVFSGGFSGKAYIN